MKRLDIEKHWTADRIEDYVSGLPIIADRGFDSDPYGDRYYVYKMYNHAISLEMIRLYDEVTRAGILVSNDYKSRSVGKFATVDICVNPIKSVIKGERAGYVYGISRRIYGEKGKNKEIPAYDDLLQDFSMRVSEVACAGPITVIPDNTFFVQGRIGNLQCVITDMCIEILNIKRTK